MAQLLRVAPASFRLVIASRSDPDLPVPRLRVLGQLAELRSEALSFTTDEAQRLLASHGLPLRRPTSPRWWGGRRDGRRRWCSRR